MTNVRIVAGEEGKKIGLHGGHGLKRTAQDKVWPKAGPFRVEPIPNLGLHVRLFGCPIVYLLHIYLSFLSTFQRLQ